MDGGSRRRSRRERVRRRDCESPATAMWLPLRRSRASGPDIRRKRHVAVDPEKEKEEGSRNEIEERR